MNDKIKNTHLIYNLRQSQREIFQAVKGGTATVRAKGETFLRKYPAESQGEYDARLARATIDGLVQSGVDILCGKVFYDEIDTSKVSAKLQPYLENFDLEGTHFNNFARLAFEHSFDGFSLILADMPVATEDVQLARQQNGLQADIERNIRPFAKIYTASNVLDWHFEVNPITNLKQLTFLKLREISERRIEIYETESVIRYRVYLLQNNVVTWQLFEERKDATGKTVIEPISDGTITNVSEIPCAIVGNFTAEPKLLNECELELKAYQKESSFDTIEYLTIPIFYTKGYPDTAPSLSLGASTHLRLPENGDVGYCQIDFQGHASLKATITEIKSTIQSRISDLAEQKGYMKAVDKTATETVVETKERNARLNVWADELKDALERTLQFVAQMAGLGNDDGGEIILRTAWSETEINDGQNQTV